MAIYLGKVLGSLEFMRPEIRVDDTCSATSARIVIGPLERGFGVTIGNALRRALLSSIKGAAITSVRIDGVVHEFSTIPGVREDVIEMLLNLKHIPIRSYSSEVRVLRLEVDGERRVTASDFQSDSEIEFVDPDAYICTLGTLHLLGRPLDIPSLMLSVVILGMGIDYSIFCVRAHQRYRDPSHPFYILVYLAVFIAGSSTLIGFGVLCLAEHSLLKSIGITSFFGIGYSMVGAFLLLPPLLARYLQGASSLTAVKRGGDRKRVAQRYRTMEAYPRMFVRCKIRLDPLFHDLERLLAGKNRMNTIVDIGCGYGVPACWCLEYFPHAKVYGLDPDPERVRVAAFALHGRGSVVQGFAPQMPPVSGPVDLVLLLDMLHYLDEDTLTSLVTNCRNVLRPDGLLVTRFVIRPEARPSFSWLWEDIRIRFGGGQAFYRTQEEVAAVLERAGFLVAVNKVAASNPELVWMSCQPSGGEVAGAKDK